MRETWWAQLRVSMSDLFVAAFVVGFGLVCGATAAAGLWHIGHVIGVAVGHRIFR